MQAGKEIWIIDDHQLFSAGMKHLLNSVAAHHDIKCFNHPNSAMSEAGVMASLVIMDFYIPGVDTLNWISEFVKSYPKTPLVIISSSISLIDKKNCLLAGATAYYPKHSPPEITLERLKLHIERNAAGDEVALEFPVCQNNLTARQVEILIQVARGHSNKKIAKILGVSPETVKSHIATIYKSISCTTRDEAVDWAREKGFL